MNIKTIQRKERLLIVKKKKSFVATKDIEISPYAEILELEERRVRINYQKIEEEGGDTEIIRNKNLESVSYYKGYNDKTVIERVSKLSAEAHKLLHYIKLRIDFANDYIKLVEQEYIDVFNSTSYAFTKAVENLVEHDLIREREYEDLYWVDPRIVFNGNRINKYPNNVTKINY